MNSKLERGGFYSQGKMKMLYSVNINKTNEALYQLHGILFKLRLRATHKNCFSFYYFWGGGVVGLSNKLKINDELAIFHNVKTA